MILFDAQNVRKYFGPEPVLDGVTFEIRAGERVALVGPNGCGKTTLLRILAGREQPDGGDCQVRASTHVGFLEQQPLLQPGRSLRDEAADALAALIDLQQESLEVAREISKTTDPAEHGRLAARYDHLQHELQHRDAYNLDHKIERVLQGLGFRAESFDQPADSLSGGEQNRLMLAKLLLAEPNLMLLDEPSNHLDIEATEWLEDFLLASSAAVIVVSHDRYFLDKVTTRTLELFRGTVVSYVGNFSAYWRQKDERLLVQRRTFERQQTEIAKAKDFIRRNAYGMKSAQAEDRRKKLARLEAEPVEQPREIVAPVMGFPKATRCGDIVLRAKRLAKTYERTLFEDVDVQITRGQRWGLLGPNGCGKTTLLRCLLGSVEPDSGDVQLGAGVQIGYFDQQLAEINQNAEAVEAIRPPKKEFNELQRRNLLARFGLTGDKVFQRVGSLSGGEQCRAALARLAAADANFLVLDEPTNHLDLWARDALERTLADFDGTVLFVSHDRFFVDQVADHLLVVEPDGVRVVEGNYQTYQRMKTVQKTDASPKEDASGSKSAPEKGPEKSVNRDGTSRPKRRFPYRKVADIEEEIFQREVSLKNLQDLLAAGETHRDGERVRRIMAQISEQEEALRTLYEHWEEATELNW